MPGPLSGGAASGKRTWHQKKICTPDRLYIDFFVHPLPLSAVAILAVNDHWGKSKFHTALTGKISDFVGLFFFPLFLCAVTSLFRNFVFHGNQVKISGLPRPWFWNSTMATLVVFVLIKISPEISRFILQTFHQQLIADPTDLTALAVLPLTYLFGKRYFIYNT